MLINNHRDLSLSSALTNKDIVNMPIAGTIIKLKTVTKLNIPFALIIVKRCFSINKIQFINSKDALTSTKVVPLIELKHKTLNYKKI